MSFLTDAVSQAEQQVKVNTLGQVNSVVSGVKGAVANARNSAISSVVGAASNTVKTAVNSVVGAAGQLITGNVSGALDTLGSAPSNVLNSALSGLGGFAGTSASLSTPGSVGAMSSSGGISPGMNLLGASARPDPVLSYTWYAQLPVINPGSTQNTAGASATSILQNIATSVSSSLTSSLGGSVFVSSAAQLPWYYVEEATLPFRAFETRSIFREGRDRKYPSKYNVDNLRLAIYMDSQNNSYQYLQAWNNAIITPFAATSEATMGGGWGRPSDYKRPIYIYMLDVTNNVLALIEYTECWPVSIDAYQMDSGSSTRVVSHVNFSVGNVFINLMPVSDTTVAGIIANPLNNAITSTINSLGSTISNVTANVAQRGISNISSGISSIFS